MFVYRKPVYYASELEYCWLLISDLQIGSTKTDYVYIKDDLKWARQNGARILINGDVFDCIFSQDKKRFRPTVLHPRLRHTDTPLETAIDWGTELLAPFAQLIDGIGVGNHDDGNVKHHNSDPVIRLIKNLNVADKADIKYLGYCGFFGYPFYDGKKFTYSVRIQYHHGSGGAAPVTKGLIDFHRSDTWVENATIIWKGHKHNKLYYRDEVQGLNKQCSNWYKHPRVHLMTGAYMDIYQREQHAKAMRRGRQAEWEADNLFAPQGKGGFLIRLKIKNETALLTVEDRVKMYEHQAIE